MPSDFITVVSHRYVKGEDGTVVRTPMNVFIPVRSISHVAQEPDGAVIYLCGGGLVQTEDAYAPLVKFIARKLELEGNIP